MSEGGPVYLEPGLFSHRLSGKDYEGKPCLFLDRDGVLVEETNYLHRTEDVVPIAGVAQAIAKVNAAGLPAVMVTNQAGVGRGYYSWEEFEVVQQHLLELCKTAGGRFDMALACAYHADGTPPYRFDAHPSRKPAPGMLLEAARVLKVDLASSHIVGDTLADLEAGARAGLSGGTLVLTGHGEREWRSSGQAAFAEYQKAGSFLPRLAENAAEAIEIWLAALTREAGAA